MPVELLLRNRSALGLSSDLPIGHRFHTNADSMGVVFDAADPHHASSGPTITTSLVHRERTKDGRTRTVLVQEGGFPRGVEAAFSTAFRSPALLASNRFLEAPLDGVGVPSSKVASPPNVPDDPYRGGHAMASPTDGVIGGMRAVDLRAYLPHDLALVLANAGKDARATAEREIGAVVARVIDAIAESHARRLTKWLSFGRSPRRLFAALLWFVRRIVAALAGGETFVARRAVASLESQLALDDGTRFVERAIGTLTGATTLDGTARDDFERRAEILCMGTDDAPAVLELEPPRLPDLAHRLLARRPIDANAAVDAVELRLMRDLARTYGGELRTEPLHHHARKPITVHAHGGLAFGSVTDGSGRVHGAPGLFVVDGSLLPTSIGVNPSATIAALAERIAEGAIRVAIGNDDWRAPEFDRAAAWAEKRRAMLDPLRSTRGSRSAPPRSESIGLAFDERMRGFLGPIEPESPEASRPIRAQRAENRGRGARGGFELAFTAVIDDLDSFLRGDEHHVRVSNGPHGLSNVTLDLPFLGLRGTYPMEGSLRMFEPAQDRGSRLEYRLHFSAGGTTYRIEAEKWLGDGAGPSPIVDGAALYSVLFAEGRTLAMGTARLAMDDFLSQGVPSVRALGTDDLVQRALAVSRFLAFFGRTFAGVYAPQWPLAIATRGTGTKVRGHTIHESNEAAS